MAPNRLVAVLTPLVFAPLAGAITAWAAQHAPGVPPLDATQLTALFAAGAAIAFGKAALWMRGWHVHMQSPDGHVGTEQDDDLSDADATLPAHLHPDGDYDPSADFSLQPHSEGNGSIPVLS